MDSEPIREPPGTVPILRSPRSKMGLSPSPGRFSDRPLSAFDLEVPVSLFPTGWQAGLARALKIKVLSAQLAGNRPGVVSLPIRCKAPRVTSFSFGRGEQRGDGPA